MSDPRFYSISRLQKYAKCPQMYEWHYLKKLYRSETTDSLLLGSMVHDALEAYYLKEVSNPLEALQASWEKFLQDRDLGQLAPELLKIANEVGVLQWRASEACTDRSLQIRNKDGSIPKNVAMNGKYKAEVERLGLDVRSERINHMAQSRADLQGIDLSYCYAESRFLLTDYQDIPGISQVHHVEFPISDKIYRVDAAGLTVRNEHGVPEVDSIANPVQLPQTQNYLNGYVDLIANVYGKIALIDHKTSAGDAPDVVTVMYWDQLLLYAWAYKQLTGNAPYYIGINHLRSRQCVLAPINWDLVEDAVARFEHNIISAELGHFCKRSPTEYQSPCVGGAKSMSDVKRVCPYLDLCYPQLHQVLQSGT